MVLELESLFLLLRFPLSTNRRYVLLFEAGGGRWHCRGPKGGWRRAFCSGTPPMAMSYSFTFPTASCGAGFSLRGIKRRLSDLSLVRIPPFHLPTLSTGSDRCCCSRALGLSTAGAIGGLLSGPSSAACVHLGCLAFPPLPSAYCSIQALRKFIPRRQVAVAVHSTGQSAMISRRIRQP